MLCVDALCHLWDRFGTLREWARLLREGGRLVFADLAVITGPVTKSELDIRTATGFFLFVPPGVNEEAIRDAGLILVRSEDRTAAVAELADLRRPGPDGAGIEALRNSTRPASP